MSTSNTELQGWFKYRHKWLQEAARRLLNKVELYRQDYIELADICKKESERSLDNLSISLNLDEFSVPTDSTLKLSSIGNIAGINALNPKSPLSFGDSNLSVVYGGNSSGKSGYVRILKHVCDAKHQGYLLHNVFKDSPVEQGCTISYVFGGEPKECSWLKEHGVIDELRSVYVFDASCGYIYINKETEVEYEPAILKFFQALINTCQTISSLIEEEIQSLISRKPEIPVKFRGTIAGKWYIDLNPLITTDDVDLYCEWPDELKSMLGEVNSRLAESSPAEKARQFRIQKQHIDALVESTRQYIEKLSNDNVKKIYSLKKQSSDKKAAAQVAAEALFREAPLAGVGSDVWANLWEAARKYSQEQAYLDKTFPFAGEEALCVLCQQIVSEDAKKRFVSFEEFVKGQVQKEADKAEKLYKDAIDCLGDFPNDASLRTNLSASGITEESTITDVLATYASLRLRYDQIKSNHSFESLAAVPIDIEWLIKFSAQSVVYENNAKRYDEDAKNDRGPELEQRKLELQALEWLTQQRNAVTDEITRLKIIHALNNAKRLTATGVLSTKKGEIADELITQAFVSRFNQELKDFGAAHIQIELVRNRTDIGRVYHCLKLKDCETYSPGDILSEGEYRIISLAAFLADVTGKTTISPIVFDDPISSLDQKYEEAVVTRLVKLSKERQVIVFTHRLSLLGLVQEYAKKDDIVPHIVCVTCEPWGTGEPGATPLNVPKPYNALNRMINDKLPKARAIYEADGTKAYTPHAKALCTEFRILIERMVELVLLADVVSRFRRAVNTQGKIENLANITAKDCMFFDKLMTEYSKYEHSQSDETPVELPLPDKFKEDFETLKGWHDEFKNRGTA